MCFCDNVVISQTERAQLIKVMLAFGVIWVGPEGVATKHDWFCWESGCESSGEGFDCGVID